ncbi:MAG: DNA repair protein RecN, partial [Bernardetiaceae bacterium]|nr:DNA repair protein RecN [Bernardetiaceae bacterium]
MLKHLLIKNYALIRQLELAPSGHLNIITGETGAGKSIMLGAIGLMLGERADTKVLLDEGEKCVVEGQFELAAYPELPALFAEADLDFEPTCSLRREISPAGKSRAFVNDTPVTLDVLRQIGERLMDVHSQHDTLLLAADEYQLQMVDAFAVHPERLAQYQAAYRQWRGAEQIFQKLIKEADESRKELDYHSFLLAELQKADLDHLDQEAAEQELEKLDNVEGIKAALATSLQALSTSEQAADNSLRAALAELKRIANFGPAYTEYHQRLNSLVIELRDLVRALEAEEEGLFYDDERAHQLRTQLDQAYTLQKKHLKNSVPELRQLRQELAEKVSRVQNLDDELAAAQTAAQQARQQMEALARQLSESRQAVLASLEQQTNQLLKDLGMPNAQLSVELAPVPPGPRGADLATFLFSANKGVRPEPLKSVASGGEFSRLMLCLKYILAGKTALPTIIFDEIDTGISGEVALKVGRMLSQMAQRHQLFVISHLPQTAANGDCHFFVYKDETAQRTESRLRRLSPEERVREIAQMIGGASPSPTALQSAK